MNGLMKDLEYTLIVKEGNNLHLSPYLHEFTKMLANHNYLAIDLLKITLLYKFSFYQECFIICILNSNAFL